MDLKRFTGPQAGSQKYDLLTAMAVAGLNGTPGFQCSMLRMIALVTARYNWRTDELTVGQKEMSRMWSVDERTVKREIKRLTESRILLQLRPGVRGRVAAYRLNCPEIHRLSEPVWAKVGPDFSARMEAQASSALEKVVKVDFVNKTTTIPPVAQAELANPWGRVRARLSASDPTLYGAWFSKLSFVSNVDRVLNLAAPTDFLAKYIDTHHATPLRGAAELEFGPLHRIVLTT